MSEREDGESSSAGRRRESGGRRVSRLEKRSRRERPPRPREPYPLDGTHPLEEPSGQEIPSGQGMPSGRGIPSGRGRPYGRGRAVRRPAARRTRLRFTRRFYVLLGILAGVILLVTLILTLSGGSGGNFKSLHAGARLSDAELNRLKVNELGAIMILVYHRIGEEGKQSRTPENFLSDLEYLYEQGYRCVSLRELVANHIAVEPGYTPVVITFDEADPSQFRYLEEDGRLQVDPRCAMGIMENFAKEHPDFNMTATFFVLPQLFGQEEYEEMKLRYLVEHGYDIGCRTPNNVELGGLGDAKVLQELAESIRMVKEFLPDYEPMAIALPGGSRPKNPSLLGYGEYEGVRIAFAAALLEGSNPAPAPCDHDFDPLSLPRIKAMDPSLDTTDSGLYAWLRYFMENPERRYVSDGDPFTVTVPKHMEERVDMEKLGNRRLRLY